MLTHINSKEHPELVEKFKETVRNIFPILCFTPAETEAFIAEFDPEYDDNIYVYKDAQGCLTFCRYTHHGALAWSIQFVIPAVWANRYAMVSGAIAQIRNDFLAAHTALELRMRVDEQMPSHAAYFMGMLPGLGFELAPRVGMRADYALLDELDLPALPPGIAELPFEEARLAEYPELFFQVDSVYHEGYSPEKINHERAMFEDYIPRACESENIRPTWTLLVKDGQLIGASFGGAWDDELSIEEVGILSAYYGQGLGRYLTIRCMQKLRQHYGGEDKYFMLGTFRTYTRALKLYHRLGFTIDKIESYATLANQSTK
ncbi:MAG: GNAT family N-acetyltransferase [Caldilineaceae bacterium]|nr:GNAT family N-acetyltransferase [Caldilineaceae bacterium]